MKNIWIERVKADSKRYIREENERKQNYYKNRYGRTKTYEFPPKDKINFGKYFYFHKPVVEIFDLSKIALAVYPVMCLKADFIYNTWFQIPQEEIAVKSGLSINTVNKALQELEFKGLLEKEKQNSGRTHYYVYKVEFIRKSEIQEYEGDFITFNQSIVDSGVWAGLKLRSKALYLAFRTTAFHDIEPLFYDEEIFDGSYINYNQLIKNHIDNYVNRKFDMCKSSISALCELVGIDSSNISPILRQLENHGLIKKYDEVFEVYLKPKIS